MTQAPPLRSRCRPLGLLVAVLALVSQVAVGSVVWPDDAAQGRIAALHALTVLCQGRKPVAPSHLPAHRPGDLSVCPPAAAFAVPLALVDSDPVVPAPRLTLPLRISAPPSRPPGAQFPRGPPRLA